MNPAILLAQVQADGLTLALDPPDTLSLRGDRDARARWLPEVRANKPALVSLLIGPDTEPHRLWLIELPDGQRFSTSYDPPATAAEVQSWHPGARVEPADGVQPQHPTDLTAGDEIAIRAWLAHIGEQDPAIIAETLTRCRSSTAALAYFIGRAGEATGVSNAGEAVLPDAPRYAGWSVTYADGSTEDLVFDPPASRAEVERRRPVALSYRPAGTQATQRNMQRNTAATRAHLEATPC